MLKKVAKNIAQQFFDGKDPVSEIVKYASDNTLNAHEVDRLCNDVNRNIISSIQREVPAGRYDPHFTFDTIKTAEVIGLIGRPSMAAPTIPGSAPSASSVVSGRAEGPLDYTTNKTIARMGILYYLREQIEEKKRKYIMLCNKINDLIMNMKKEASSQILNNTPVEVLRALPAQDVIDEVLEKAANEWGHKLAHLNKRFELDTGATIYKIAVQIEKLREEADEVKREMEALEYDWKSHKNNR